MDKVTVTDASESLAQVDVFGPGAAGALAALGLADAPEPDRLATFTWQGETVRALGQSGRSASAGGCWSRTGDRFARSATA